MTDTSRRSQTALQAAPAAWSDPLQRRLRALVGIRCLMVTLLLGSALAVNINNAASFRNPGYAGLTSVIVATYALTVAFAIWLRTGRATHALATSSYLTDALLAAALVLLTGRFESPFTYLFLMVALYGGVIDGRRGGLLAATLASAGILLVLAFERGLVDVSWLPNVGAPHRSPLFTTVTLSAAAFAVGLLSGVLRERIESTTDELVASEREVEALRGLHERILTSLRSGVMTTDAVGRINYVNPAARLLLGRPGNDVLGHDLAELGLEPPLERLGDDETRWESEFDHGDGRVVLGLTRTSLALDAGESRGDVITFQDLTQLRRTERQLAQHERLATVGRFAASIAHEIRNPLASISGSIELLASSLDGLSEDDATLMRIVIAEIERLNGLVRAILDYAGPRTLVSGEVDLGDVIEDVQLIFANDPLARDIELRVELDASGDSPARVAADPEVVRQILINLWRNAAQALQRSDCDPGVGEDEPGPAIIATRIEHLGTDVLIRVEDSGPGIPAELAERVFEPFFTTHDGGTGLGLATVYQLALEMDGSVRLLMERDEGPRLGGAVFEVRLPASEARAPLPATVAHDDDAHHAAARR